MSRLLRIQGRHNRCLDQLEEEEVRSLLWLPNQSHEALQSQTRTLCWTSWGSNL